MRLLLTRAATDAARTKEKLKALGHDVILSPVIEIVGTHAIWPPGVTDAVLATSSHAFVVPTEGPLPEVKRLVPLFLVGSQTQVFARTSGFIGPATVAKNAISLAIEVRKRTTSPKRIVYIAGRDRKPEIETALGVLGHQVDVIEAYEARALETPSNEATRVLRYGGIDAILHFSRRSAALLLAMASTHGLDIRRPAHVCLSEDVATPLRDAGLDDIHVAEAPTESALFDMLQEARE